MKVLTVVGTRPEIIRLSRIINALDHNFEHILVHTGQNYDYELSEVFFKDLEIRMPDYFLESAEGTPADTVGKIISKVDKILMKTLPDAILILGDTNSCLSAYAAKRRKIPIFHMEAGNRCFDQRVPEEINRKIVDHISDINMPYSTLSREYLIREGISPDRIIKTGSPMFEVLEYYKPKIKNSTILDKLNLDPYEYFLFSSHREENIDSKKNFYKLINILKSLSKKYKKRIIFTTHPRTRNQIKKEKISLSPLVEFHNPFCLTDYLKLQLNAITVLSDSGTITEESSILNFPAINVRESHERPEGMEEGSVMMLGLSWDRINNGLSILINQYRGENRTLKIVEDYNSANVSEKVIRIILSYTHYINKFVWHKEE